MSYNKINNYFFGYCNNSISNLYKNYFEFFKNLSVLITCLDSDANLSNKKLILNSLDNNNCKYELLGKSIYVDSKYVKNVFEDKKIITHFDEIYLFETNPNKETIINESYTTDGYNFERDVPSEFINLFKKICAKRYLSDGCGLNFVCESEIIASKLINVRRIPGTDGISGRGIPGTRT